MADIRHVGVLGMHWGIRKRGPASSDFTKAREIKKRHVSELSNEELKTVINRLQLEKQYSDISQATASKGQSLLKGLLVRVGVQAVNNIVSQKAGPEYAAYQAVAQAIRERTGKKSG